MPRHARLDSPGMLHHVIARGLPGTRIFTAKRDKEDFLHRIAGLCETDAIAVYAWALMDTHVHLLVRTGRAPLSSSMRKLLTGFVVTFNKRHNRYGHLFQNRYKSIVCEDDPYLLQLTRYIHLNPIRAGLVKDVAELDSYAFTGHTVIMGKASRPWQDTNTILAYFGTKGIDGYRRFVEGGIDMNPDLSGGGLTRSAGGVREVASLRKQREPMASDERILGSGAFVQSILAENEKDHDSSLALRASVPDLSTLARLVAHKEKVDPEELLSCSRKRPLVHARRILCRIAVRKLRYTGASVARFLGLSTSLVNRMANEKGEDDFDEYFQSSL